MFSIEKLEAPKNFPPYTIFPFDEDVIADILCGKIWIFYLLNISEVFRILKIAGWDLVYSFYNQPTDKLSKTDLNSQVLHKVKKNNIPLQSLIFDN